MTDTIEHTPASNGTKPSPVTAPNTVRDREVRRVRAELTKAQDTFNEYARQAADAKQREVDAEAEAARIRTAQNEANAAARIATAQRTAAKQAAMDQAKAAKTEAGGFDALMRQQRDLVKDLQGNLDRLEKGSKS